MVITMKYLKRPPKAATLLELIEEIDAMLNNIARNNASRHVRDVTSQVMCLAADMDLEGPDPISIREELVTKLTQRNYREMQKRIFIHLLDIADPEEPEVASQTTEPK